MKANSNLKLVLAAASILLLLPGGACNGGSERNGGPVTAADKAALEAAAEGEGADRWVDDRMRFLEEYVLSGARGTAGRFPSYNEWLSEVSSSVRHGEPAPAPDSDLVSRAESELAPFKRELGETTDVSLITAYEEGTRLGLLGQRLVSDFRSLSDGARDRAADRLRDRYRLP